MDLSEYRRYHEIKNHARPGFAYNTYICTIPVDFPRVSLHWHDQMELIYIKKGRGTVTVNLHRMPVEKGCVVPVLPGELHSIEAQERMEYENIIFSLSMLDSAGGDDWCKSHVIQPLQEGILFFTRPIVPGSAFHEAVSSALDLADRVCDERAPGYYLMVKSALFRFMYALYSFRQTPLEVAYDRRPDRLKVLLTWVREHYMERLTVEQAASVLGYSPSHFMRTFKEETGQTFVRYLNEYRLSAAAYYLSETDRPVSRIAQECGFDNLSYFMRSFKRAFGMSPGAYRKSRRNGIAAHELPG